MKLEDKLLNKCQHVNGSECWSWTGHKGAYGHGLIKVDGKTRRAHRVSHELFIGPIPEGQVVIQTCGRNDCTNPKHLLAIEWADYSYVVNKNDQG